MVMDPTFSVALGGNCIGIALKAGKLCHELQLLHARFKHLETHLQFLKIQISAIKAATERLAQWLKNQENEVEDSLYVELSDTLYACDGLIGVIQENASKTSQSPQKLPFRSKAKYLWNESNINLYRDMLQTQVQALQLILQCMQLPIRSEQEPIRNQVQFNNILTKLRDDGASIIGMRDQDTCCSTRSVWTVKDSDVDLHFAFDSEIMSSRVYRSTFASLLKQNLRSKKGNPSQMFDTTSIWNMYPDQPDHREAVTVSPTRNDKEDERATESRSPWQSRVMTEQARHPESKAAGATEERKVWDHKFAKFVELLIEYDKAQIERMKNQHAAGAATKLTAEEEKLARLQELIIEYNKALIAREKQQEVQRKKRATEAAAQAQAKEEKLAEIERLIIKHNKAQMDREKREEFAKAMEVVIKANPEDKKLIKLQELIIKHDKPLIGRETHSARHTVNYDSFMS